MYNMVAVCERSEEWNSEYMRTRPVSCQITVLMARSTKILIMQNIYDFIEPFRALYVHVTALFVIFKRVVPPQYTIWMW